MASKNTGLQSYLKSYSDYKTRNIRDPTLLPSPNPESWTTAFPSSQAECIDQLHRIKNKIRREEESIATYVRDYQQSVVRQLDSEYQVLRSEILKELDKTYEQNKIKVRVGFGRDDMDEINGTIRDLRSLYLRIQELLRELETGSTYKKGIAGTVMEDFENKRRIMVNKIRQAINRYETNSFLKVESSMFQKVKNDINSLFTYNNGASLGSASKGFGETASFKPINFPIQDQQLNIKFNPSPYEIQNQRPSMSSLKPPVISQTLEIQKQPFSFQPSRASENEKGSFNQLQSSPSNVSQQLRQSSAQQFSNAFARQFEQQYRQSQIVNSQVEPFPSPPLQPSSILRINPHRNRDLLKTS